MKNLEALDKLLERSTLADILCDLETICKAKAQSNLDKGDHREYSRWDSHAISLGVVCNLIRDEEKRRSERK